MAVFTLPETGLLAPPAPLAADFDEVEVEPGAFRRDPSSLAEAEGRLRLLGRMELTVRLEIGKTARWIRETEAYREHPEYQTWDDYVTYGKHGTTREALVELIRVYEVFCLRLAYDPAYLQQRVHYSHLVALLPAVELGEGPYGAVVVTNAADIREYVEMAHSLKNAGQLRKALADARDPEAVPVTFRLGDITWDGADNVTATLLPIQGGMPGVGAALHLGVRSYRVLKDALERAGCLTLDEQDEPPYLRGPLRLRHKKAGVEPS